jgi:hypothetical protein
VIGRPARQRSSGRTPTAGPCGAPQASGDGQGGVATTTRRSAEAVLWDLGGPPPVKPRGSGDDTLIVAEARDPASLRAYGDLRHRVFVDEQGVFPVGDRDELDDDPRTVVLFAQTAAGDAVRFAPDPLGPDGLAAALGEALDARLQRDGGGRNDDRRTAGRALAHAHRWDTTVRAHLALYERLLHRRRRDHASPARPGA